MRRPTRPERYSCGPGHTWNRSSRTSWKSGQRTSGRTAIRTMAPRKVRAFGSIPSYSRYREKQKAERRHTPRPRRDRTARTPWAVWRGTEPILHLPTRGPIENGSLRFCLLVGGRAGLVSIVPVGPTHPLRVRGPRRRDGPRPWQLGRRRRERGRLTRSGPSVTGTGRSVRPGASMSGAAGGSLDDRRHAVIRGGRFQASALAGGTREWGLRRA